jgi:hypothetical protein
VTLARSGDAISAERPSTPMAAPPISKEKIVP